ncbi:MAG: Ppx/GppA family phosphatase, partial [Chloroflexaceae bacterium]|nr:Ppx/GppA family phosphatase [Chloroflexaceae bacterium]
MQRVGIIDLGSNTTRLMVIAYMPHHSFRLVDEVSSPVRLAEGVGDDQHLQPLPMQRAIEVLRMFHTFCQSTRVQHLLAVGTSAVREAANQVEFLERLQRETGLPLRVLSGKEEAYYGYLGVVNSTTITHGYVIDIGGGSTEVTEVYERGFSRSFSQQVGTVRLLERFVQSDPIGKHDFRMLEQGTADAFADLNWLQASPGSMLVGIGGTIRNLARIDQKRRHYPLGRVHHYILTLASLESIIGLLRRSDATKRAAIPGLNRERADIILPGAMILRQLMHQGNFDAVLVSGSGLREGLFYEHFLKELPSPLVPDVRRFSVNNLAHLCTYEAEHVNRVTELTLSLFDQFHPWHGYGAWERELLAYAATLHDIGVQVGYYDHHKHSAYLVVNAALNGFSHREIALLALLVKLHRKGSVDTREYQAVLNHDDGERAARLGSFLRIAEYLERSKSQVVQGVRVDLEAEPIRVFVQATGDATVEIWAANERANLFRSAFGRISPSSLRPNLTRIRANNGDFAHPTA